MVRKCEVLGDGKRVWGKEKSEVKRSVEREEKRKKIEFEKNVLKEKRRGRRRVKLIV